MKEVLIIKQYIYMNMCVAYGEQSSSEECLHSISIIVTEGYPALKMEHLTGQILLYELSVPQLCKNLTITMDNSALRNKIITSPRKILAIWYYQEHTLG